MQVETVSTKAHNLIKKLNQVDKSKAIQMLEKIKMDNFAAGSCFKQGSINAH